MITKEVILDKADLEILREFMKSKAGRTLDIRTEEGALIYGILYQISYEPLDEDIGVCCRNGCEKCEQ